MEKTEKHLERLVERGVSLTNREGKTIDEGRNAIMEWFDKKYETGNFCIQFTGFGFPHSSYGFRIEIKQNDETVLKVRGEYKHPKKAKKNKIIGPPTLKVEAYTPGEWEQKYLL